jgi:hypothetical protein
VVNSLSEGGKTGVLFPGNRAHLAKGSIRIEGEYFNIHRKILVLKCQVSKKINSRFRLLKSVKLAKFCSACDCRDRQINISSYL